MASRSSAADAPVEAAALLGLLERARGAADGAAPLEPGKEPGQGLAPGWRAYRVESLALTLHGYRVQRRSGWRREPETVFSLARPPFWRRLLRAPIPLACTLSVHAGGVEIAFAAAPGRAVRAAAGLAAIRLSAPWQVRLEQAHGAAAVRVARHARLLAWLRARRAAGPSETVT